MIKTLRFKSIIPSLALAAVAALGMTACEEDDDIIFLDPIQIRAAVAVFVDSTYDFTQLVTFAMPDTVMHLHPVTGTPLPIPRNFDRTILDEVRANLLARGYVEELNPGTNTPDFIVLAGTTATANHAAFVSFSWFPLWGFYDGFQGIGADFDDTWGIVYPWHPVAGVASFPRGTIVVDLIPTGPQINPLTRNIQSAWAGVATGLMNGRVTNAGVAAAIDQMFLLSPYLSAPQINPL
jgi:hypothetical protein